MSVRHLIPETVRNVLRPIRRLFIADRPRLLGYVRERSRGHVAGWISNHDNAAARVAFDVVTVAAGVRRIVSTGIADRFDPDLALLGLGDGHYGFLVTFDPPLSDADYDSIMVCPHAGRAPLPYSAQPIIGYLRACSRFHVAGWMQSRANPSEGLAFEAICTLPGAERVLGHGIADVFDPELAQLSFDDPNCGFRLVFPQPISAHERAHVEVRPIATGAAIPRAKAALLGYLCERTTRHVAGWLSDPNEPDAHVAYEVVCTLPGAERVLARGTADLLDPSLGEPGVHEARRGFRTVFAAGITALERDHVEVRPLATGTAIPHAQTPLLGYVRERTTRHVAGWLSNPFDTSLRVAFKVVCTLAGHERVLATGTADQHDRVLAALGFADAVHGFRIVFDAPISELERDHVEVRTRDIDHLVPHDPALQTGWKPIRYIAMDIVDNCNLRCPFCLFDHAPVYKTNVMSDEVFAAALRLLPYVGPEGHWMSCLHEPTMHPRLTEFLRRIPAEYRHVMTYTTNLARRMPDGYFETLASSGLSNLNVSIESRDPAIYERMRKGAKHRVFMENWDKLLAAFAIGSAPPPLRYIAMAYKSNYREIPSLIEYLRNERRAWKIEIRDTYDVAHIPPEFRAQEFLERDEWLWLQAALRQYSPHEVTLSLPPGFTVEEPAVEALATTLLVPSPVPAVSVAAEMPGLLEARILHDGSMIVTTSAAGNYPNHGTELARLNILDMKDPMEFLMALTEGAPVLALSEPTA